MLYAVLLPALPFAICWRRYKHAEAAQANAKAANATAAAAAAAAEGAAVVAAFAAALVAFLYLALLAARSYQSNIIPRISSW